MRFISTERFLTQKKLYFRFLKEKRVYGYYKLYSLSDDRWGLSALCKMATILDRMHYTPYRDWVVCSFSWERTNQGLKFWSNISRQFRIFMNNIKEELAKNALYGEL